ncbi:MAG: prolyl oligopeptidase family serine peptidase [Fimbriimonadaceae bacterium]|nr:prolyl oligopeptidase family serine peptidase [Fimbriimonadaceae bacterium]
MAETMIGAYGPWFADQVLGDGPASLSLRAGYQGRLGAWRRRTRQRVLERLGPVDLGGCPEVQVEASWTWDGLHIEQLSWQLPMGPRTAAVFLRPVKSRGKLPAILALHDHGGQKYLGWRKIIRCDDAPWPVVQRHQDDYYGGVGWATELARRGYAVLCHDTFPFASRRVRPADLPAALRGGAGDPEPTDEEGIVAYNGFAAAHEHLMAKSLYSAGTTWPGVYLVEDQRALDVLCARPEVDPRRVGCGGLSGGGMRTTFLAGLDDRIRCAVCVGFMTTWRDFLLDKCFTHTWMTYVPRLPAELDFPEILGLRAPAATMVQNCWQDGLFTVPEMERAVEQLHEVFAAAGRPERFRAEFYDGGHKFDRAMQADAFGWFDAHLRRR